MTRGMATKAIAHKKLDSEMLKKRKQETAKPTSEKASKKRSTAAKTKDPNAPKRPATAFFVFMEEFRKSYKEEFPDNKAVSAVTKAGGENWKSLSESEKVVYTDKAQKRKEEYQKAVEAYNNKENAGEDNTVESAKSSSEEHDEDGDEDEELLLSPAACLKANVIQHEEENRK
ncbi:high mobility group B protein 3-like [Rutidosis leptorrhynchoides]|uniref:high mobility group B protein 3-like n=1 Tax=Rutidosis leptorrhynchoides TaxID=125765 RepID=UPI003A99C374